MITKRLLVLSCFLAGVWMACSSPDNVERDPKKMAAYQLPLPEPALTFDYLLYDNDYNAVPVDEDATYYTKDVLDSALVGLAYQLTNEVAFAPGVVALVKPEKRPTWYHVNLRVLKQSEDMLAPFSARGIIVFSWERAGNMVHYSTYPIKELLKEQNRHMIDKWETVETWHKVPEDIQEGDLMRIYVWNPEGGTIYIDDMSVTAWSKQQPPVELSDKKMRLLVEQSYEHEAPSGEITNQYAYRGTYSNVVGSLPNYNSYGRTYTTTMQEAQLEGGDILRISFAALKQDKLQRSDHAALIVCSVERNGQSIYWEGKGINSRLWENNEQLIKKWKKLDWWQVLPLDVRPTDVLKVYAWNTRGVLVFIDDLSVEVVEKE